MFSELNFFCITTSWWGELKNKIHQREKIRIFYVAVVAKRGAASQHGSIRYFNFVVKMMLQTSVGSDGLCPPEEAEVAGPGVGLRSVAPRHQPAHQGQSSMLHYTAEKTRVRSSPVLLKKKKTGIMSHFNKTVKPNSSTSGLVCFD